MEKDEINSDKFFGERSKIQQTIEIFYFYSWDILRKLYILVYYYEY